MRILLVGINYAPDLIGVAKYNTELCEGLAALGHEVRVVTAPPYYPEWQIPRDYSGWSYRQETVHGITVTRSPIYVPGKPTGAKRLLHHASFAFTSLWPVLTLALRWRPDVVLSVAPSLMSAGFSAWIARRIGALSWLHLQDFEIDAAFDLGILANAWLRAPMVAVERKILRSFDYVSTISPQMVERLKSKGVDAERVSEVRNWTDTSQIAPGEVNSRFRREQLGLDERHFVCLYAGTMSNKQGLDLIIDAAQALDSADSNIQFVLCGDGPQRIWLQRLADGRANVRFLGLQTDESFAALLNAVDVHLVPQKAEAADLVLPSKLGGILASGKPVIVMAKPESGLALEVQRAGIVVPPGDVQALAEAVRSLAAHDELCASLGKEARAIALSRWDKTATLKALDEMLGKQRASADSDSSSGALLSTKDLPRKYGVRVSER